MSDRCQTHKARACQKCAGDAGSLTHTSALFVRHDDRCESEYEPSAHAWTPCGCWASRAEAEGLVAELERLHSWSGLLSLLDEHWPEGTFPTLTDDAARDTGPRLVAALRRLGAANVAADQITEWRKEEAVEVERLAGVVAKVRELADEWNAGRRRQPSGGRQLLSATDVVDRLYAALDQADRDAAEWREIHRGMRDDRDPS